MDSFKPSILTISPSWIFFFSIQSDNSVFKQVSKSITFIVYYFIFVYKQNPLFIYFCLFPLSRMDVELGRVVSIFLFPHAQRNSDSVEEFSKSP